MGRGSRRSGRSFAIAVSEELVKRNPMPFWGLAHALGGTRRLLLISYHFPPSREVGGLRWQKLAAHAAAHGWGLDVITRDPVYLTGPDPARLEDLPAGTRVYGVPERPTFLQRSERGALALRNLLRSNNARPLLEITGNPAAAANVKYPMSLGQSEVRWLPPSPRKLLRAYNVCSNFVMMQGWTRTAVAIARSIIVPGQHQAIITCGPPHLPHEGGRLLAQETGLRHIVDLRDPWSLQERLPEGNASPLYYTFHRYYERRSMACADLVVSNNPSARDALQRLYPNAAERLISVLNGYDEERVASSRNDRFLLAYAGSIYYDRDPRLIFRAAARLVRELNLVTRDFGIRFIGSVGALDGVPIQAIAEEEGIGAFFQAEPPQPRREVLRHLSEASMLLSLPQDCHLAIPAKIFEYMAFDAWVLVLAETGSASAEVLRGTAADIVAPGDLEGIVKTLRERYRLHRLGVRPPCLAHDPRFSRANQAQVLFERIEDCVRRHAKV